MELASDLIKQFVDATNDSKSSTNNDKTLNATAVVNDDGVFVEIDGSTIRTPVATAADVRNGDRVLVTIENHQANIIGNITSPASGRGASDLYDETLKEDGSIEPSGSLAPAKVFVDTLTAKNVTADSILADSAKIKKLETDKISATDADLKYAKIDFTNITEATMEYFYSKSGLIKNVTVGDQTITGELIGVTIKGDIIEGGTVKADKLVIKGEDGLFYKLNVDALGETTASSDKKYQNGLDGSAIIAKSITAEQISVKDLVAFGATIGGFKIGDDSIYSGVKSSVDNTTRGIYFDNDGQFSFGDSRDYIKFYKDTDGEYHLKIAAKSLIFGSSSSSVEDEINTLKDAVDTANETANGAASKADLVAGIVSGTDTFDISVSGSINEENVQIDIQAASASGKFTTPGEYVFSYAGSGWKLGGNDAILSEYGITLKGMPSAGDTITVVYDDSGLVDDIDELNKKTDNISSDIGSLKDSSSELHDQANNLSEATSKLKTVQESTAKELAGMATELEGYRGCIVINSNEPSITIGAGSSTKTNLKITPEKMLFMNNGNEAASLSNDTLKADSAEITNLYMRSVDNSGNVIGTLGWIARTNGHLSLKVIG